MASQIHTKFTNDQVKELLEKYLKKEVERKYIEQILGIGKSVSSNCSKPIAATRKNSPSNINALALPVHLIQR